MLPPLRQVLQEYHPLIIKLYGDTLVKPAVKGSKKNYNIPVDVRQLVSLAVILPFLQTIKNLIVFAQSLAIYICDFIGHLTNYGQKANFWTFSIFSHRGNYLGGPPRFHGFG
jgi:hypothetical protein